MSKFPSTATSVGGVKKYENLAQLSMWGVVCIEASDSGFAMEFVEDMLDSSVGGNIQDSISAGKGLN